MTTTTVGVVGLGAMGKPIAQRLAQAGFEVLGCDPHATANGVHMVDTIEAADFVFVIVPTDDDVTAVVTGLLATGRAGLTIAISASVRPETCRTLATQAATQGIDILDVALTGGIRGAENGTLNLLVGGDRAVADKAADIFEAIASDYHVLGPVGAGQAAKAASNLIHWAEIVAIEEAMRLANAYGVQPADLRAALQHGGTDSRTLRELELMHFTWYAKDIATAQDMAKAANVELPVAKLSRDLMDNISPESIRKLLSKD
jgi:3-hydroxyisobutyrate dehydrogenase-like beta-hydroxyacid dehydrogenase